MTERAEFLYVRRVHQDTFRQSWTAYADAQAATGDAMPALAAGHAPPGAPSRPPAGRAGRDAPARPAGRVPAAVGAAPPGAAAGRAAGAGGRAAAGAAGPAAGPEVPSGAAEGARGVAAAEAAPAGAPDAAEPPEKRPRRGAKGGSAASVAQDEAAHLQGRAQWAKASKLKSRWAEIHSSSLNLIELIRTAPEWEWARGVKFAKTLTQHLSESWRRRTAHSLILPLAHGAGRQKGVRRRSALAGPHALAADGTPDHRPPRGRGAAAPDAQGHGHLSRPAARRARAQGRARPASSGRGHAGRAPPRPPCSAAPTLAAPGLAPPSPAAAARMWAGSQGQRGQGRHGAWRGD